MNKKDYWKDKPNAEKIILDLCGGTGNWSKPYADAGFDVRIITKPENDVFIYDGYKELVKSVFGVLSAPTCTHFSLARTTAKTPRDLAGQFLLVQRCLDISRYCMINGNTLFWTLENPVGLLRQLLGKPFLTCNPSEYGDFYTKKSDFWGYFNAPRKRPRTLTPEQIQKCSINNRDLPQLPNNYILPNDFKPQQARRSMTSNYFAKAFFKANK